MNKHLLTFSSIILILLVGIPAAFAQVSASGEGALTAEGDGYARLSGDGWVHLTGSGLLVIEDRAGDAVIEVSGNGRKFASGSRLIYRGFDGTAHVSGTDIRVSLRGRNIVLEAEGTGTVRLVGRGTYEFNGQEGFWTPHGTTIHLQPA